MLVPSPAFRSMALGIMLSVAFILLATLTLLPAVLAWLGDRVDRLALPWVHAGEHRSPRFERWVTPLAPPRPARHPGARAPGRPRAAGPAPRHGHAVDQGRALRRRLPRRLRGGAGGVRPGRAWTLQVVAAASDASLVQSVLASDRGRRRHGAAVGRPRARARRSGGRSIRPVRQGPTIERLRGSLPAGALLGGAAAETRPRGGARGKTLPVFLVVLGLGFCCCSRRAPGAADRARGGRHEPARDGRRLRGGRARLPGRQPRASSASSRRGS